MRRVFKSPSHSPAAVAAGLVIALAFGAWPGSQPPVGAAPTQLPGDDVRINQIQVLGSHNSYHIEPQAPLYDALVALAPAGLNPQDLLYTHSPLPEQFQNEKIRQIELDVFADSSGGLYANPLANILEGTEGFTPFHLPEMDQPGFKVLHIQDFDYEATCHVFITCLQQVKDWSDSHPWHVPITILIEPKADELPAPEGLPFEFVVPEPMDAAAFDALDAEVRSVFGPDDLITPDDVRGSHATLEEAVLTDGWPTLGESRGKVMFLLDNSRTTYQRGHTSLEGLPMFTPSEPGQPDAAFVERNNPLGSGQAEIEDLVRSGYVVRTRSDEPTEEARSGDRTQQQAAFASGAQFVSTDYQVPGRAERFGTDYVTLMPGGYTARCNPVNAPEGCVDADLEIAPPEPTTTTSVTTTTPTSLATTTTAPTTTKPTPPATPVVHPIRYTG